MIVLLHSNYILSDYRSRNMIEKQVFFLDITGRGEAFSKHRFQVSGVRFQAGSRFFTNDT